MESFCWMPSTLQSSLVNSEMNCGPLSKRIVLGSLWRHHTWSLNKAAKSKEEVVLRQGKRTISLEAVNDYPDRIKTVRKG